MTSIQTQVEDLDFENDEMLRDIACFKALTPKEHHEQLHALDPGWLQQVSSVPAVCTCTICCLHAAPWPLIGPQGLTSLWVGLLQAPPPAFLLTPTSLGSPNDEASLQILASLQHLSLSLGYPASTASLPASMTSTQSSLALSSSSAGAEAEHPSLLLMDGEALP